MKTEKRKYKCEGCGSASPCFVETNQEPSSISIPTEDLKCILDETNQTGYHWVEIGVERTKVIANNAVREIIQDAHMAGQADAGVDPGYSNAQAYCDSLFPST